MLYHLLRPFLFCLPGEASHDLTLASLRGPLKTLLPARHYRKPVTVMGIEFPNPVGLAAGLDKNGLCIDGLSRFGFGFVEIGTVTPRPQPGNPKPRLFRLPEANAIINRMGFNNLGVEALVEAVAQCQYEGILGINIGKNFDTPVERAVDDYLYCLERVHAAASYVVVNVSSPNTPGLRTLQHGDALDELLATLRARATELDEQNGRRVPLVIKIAPDNDHQELVAMAEAFVTHGIDGVIVSNTTLAREGVTGLRHGSEQGGLSGQPLRERADAALQSMVKALDGRIPVIGVGGILRGEDARRKAQLGADLVQLYSGLIYRGPALVGECVHAWPGSRA